MSFFAASPCRGPNADINPREDPWKDLLCRCGFPPPRSGCRSGSCGGMGALWEVLLIEGWVWHEVEVPDYRHLGTGYLDSPYPGSPSRG